MADTRRFEFLDGLRGLAALFVVALHVGIYFGTPIKPDHAYLAVDFFFMLSGFVIAHAYGGPLSHGLSFAGFIKLRLIRLYPLIVLGLFMGVAAWMARISVMGDVGARAILQATAMNAWLVPTTALAAASPSAFPIDAPLWSLSAELAANFAYAAMARLASPLRLATGAGVAGAALGVVAFRHGSLDVGYALGEVGLGFARVAFPFLIGVVLLRVERRLGDWKLSPYVAAGLLCGVLARPEGGGATYDLVCVMLVFPAIILFAARATFNNSLDALSIRLGALSYPLYATHFPIVVVLSRAARTHADPHLAMPLIGFLAFATAVGFAFCVAVPYDIRVRAWLKNVQVIRPHPVAAQDSARDS